jgi:hypothetical protein
MRTHRAIAALTTLAFLSACTTYVPIKPDVAADEHLDGTIAFHLRDSRTLVSDDVSVTDAGFVLRSVRESGEMREIQPMLIERTDVESMERVSKNYRPLWIAGGAVLLVGMLFFVFSDEPGWGDD